MKCLVGFCVSLVLCFSAHGQVTALTVAANRSSSLVGEELQFTLTSDSPMVYCGIHVEYGGTNEPSTHIRMNVDGAAFPYTFKKSFSTPGTVQVRAYGARVMSALGCNGEGRTTVTVTAPVAAAPAPAIVSVAPPPAPDTTMADLQAKAKAGDLNAMYTLANVLANNGENAEALKLFLSAAKRNHAKAMNSTGFMYEEGRGTIQNHKEAGDWYRKAMMLGNPDAMVNRGVLLFKGLGLPVNKSQAYIHFSLGAAYATDPSLREEATKLRDSAAKQLSAAQVNTAQADAKKLAAQIAK